MAKVKVNYDTGEIVEEIENRVQARLAQINRYRPPYHRHSVPLDLSAEESMTHQSHAESCDINSIIRQFDRTGLLPPPTREGQYGDVSELNRDLTELIAEADETQQRYLELREQVLQQQKAEADLKQSQSEATPPQPTPAPATPPPAAT